MKRRVQTLIAVSGWLFLWVIPAVAQVPPGVEIPPSPTAPAASETGVEESEDSGLVQLDFTDVELAVVIDTISRLTGKNFIYDDRVRGRVTIVSPTKITVDQAYAVFESVLQVKGFTTVQGPGGAIKVIPLREAKESSIETIQGRQRPPASDRYVTRLIPLRFIDAEAIVGTLEPLISNDASMVAYPPTNTVILTDSASNIRRILSIIESIDIETYKEELSVIHIEHADATTMASQISEIYGASVSGAQGIPTPMSIRRGAPRTPVPTSAAETAEKGIVRIITDERTNSLIVLASRSRTEEIRRLVARLDVPVTGGGRIHVHYLKHADAEELTETLNALITGQRGVASVSRDGGPAPAALRAAVTELSEGVTITADPPTNSLVVQTSQEGYRTLAQVIDLLDVPRPQVLVEALIMEINITNTEDLGFSGIGRIFRGDTNYALGSLTDTVRPSLFGTPAAGGTGGTGGTGSTGSSGGTGPGTIGDGIIDNLIAAATRSSLRPVLVPKPGDPDNFIPALDAFGNPIFKGSLIQGIIRASASDNRANIISAPHILTSDNEEAEIKVGSNIPIITSRVESAAGVDTGSGLASSVNVERQDIGVTLRVTPQISEGDSLRLNIFQEITDINQGLAVGDVNEVGVALTNRKVENTVVVSNGETVVIGGLIGENYGDNVAKIPWLGDIPILGWLFKTTSRDVFKTNLLVFLTPHIARGVTDLEYETIRKREEFREHSASGLAVTEHEKKEQEKRRKQAKELNVPVQPYRGGNPVRTSLEEHEERYPMDRMREIRDEKQLKEEEARRRAQEQTEAPRYAVLAAVFSSEQAATDTLTQLVDAGYEGALFSSDLSGSLFYEIRLGPYPSLDAAEEVVTTIQKAFGLAPQVVIERTPQP